MTSEGAMTAIVSGSPAPNRVCTLARIDIPIIQAPMTYIAGAQLAAAVSNAGALGIIETTSEQGRADLQRVPDLTDGPVGANIALLFNRDPSRRGPACGQRHSLRDYLGR